MVRLKPDEPDQWLWPWCMISEVLTVVCTLHHSPAGVDMQRANSYRIHVVDMLHLVQCMWLCTTGIILVLKAICIMGGKGNTTILLCMAHKTGYYVHDNRIIIIITTHCTCIHIIIDMHKQHTFTHSTPVERAFSQFCCPVLTLPSLSHMLQTLP